MWRQKRDRHEAWRLMQLIQKHKNRKHTLSSHLQYWADSLKNTLKNIFFVVMQVQLHHITQAFVYWFKKYTFYVCLNIKIWMISLLTGRMSNYWLWFVVIIPPKFVTKTNAHSWVPAKAKRSDSSKELHMNTFMVLTTSHVMTNDYERGTITEIWKAAFQWCLRLQEYCVTSSKLYFCGMKKWKTSRPK